MENDKIESLPRSSDKSEDRNKIVIVDADTDILELLSQVLEERGFDVKTFTQGKEVVAYLNENETDFATLAMVITERILPDMDGIHVVENIIKKFGYQVPVLLLSTLGSEADIIKGLKVGAIDYVTKPVNLTIFVEKIVAFISHNLYLKNNKLLKQIQGFIILIKI